MATGVGTGTTVVFSSGSTWSAEVTGLEIDGEEVPVIDFSHFGTTVWRESKPGTLSETPTLTIETQFNPDVPPPAKGTICTCTVTFPDASTLSGTGFFVSDSVSVPLDDKMTATVTFKFNGGTGPDYA